MLRAILMIGVLIACAGLGAHASNTLKRRLDTLRAMLAGVMEMNLRMQYSARPVRELALMCGAAETEVFFLAFAQVLETKAVLAAWQEAMDIARAHDAGFAALKEEELTAMEDYARVLGGSDLKTQAKNAALLEKRMEPVISACMDAYARKGRIYRSIGMLGGLAAVLLLW